MGYGGWGVTIYMHASCRLLYPGYFALYPGHYLTRCTGPNISASTRGFLSHRPELPSPHHGTSSTPQGST